MPTPSNLYAEKVFSEHPLVLWALDDTIISSNAISLHGSDISLPQTFLGIPAKSYGLQDTPGYYITDDPDNTTDDPENDKNYVLYAKNTGIPMVYGASNATVLKEHLRFGENYPALIIPGNGFLNEDGRYKTLTIEMWIRINTGNPDAFRIFGPINSQDGLYVDRSFLTLKIGDSVKSHFISEWSRPMLLQISVSENFASMIINGEQILTMQYDTESISLPAKIDINGKNQDWLGFYANSEIQPLEIDCIAIYPYLVPEVVAKRRFVYGQGVDFPETLNNSYNGNTVFIDYKFSNYSNNYSYPDIGKWSQGISENVSIENNILSSPAHQLPEVFISNKTSTDWINDLSTIQGNETFMSFRPNTSWEFSNAYIYFNRFNLLNEDTKAVYGVFEVPGVSSDQTLFKIEDSSSGNYIEAKINSSLSVSYVFRYNSVETTLYSETIEAGEKFFAGFDITRMIQEFGQSVFAFFGNKSRLSLYLAGNKDFSNTFTGKIYSFSFANQAMLSHISTAFLESGILSPVIVPNVFNDYLETVDYDGGTPETTDLEYDSNLLDGGTVYNIEELIVEDILVDNSSYTLFLKNILGSYSLDIRSKSSWQDYLPLSYFAKYVNDVSGNKIYDLDFLQFNVKYPESYKIVDSKINTSNSLARTYISFQTLESGANKNLDSFENRVDLHFGKVVEPGSEYTTSAYEVVNGTVVYLPSGIDISKMAICMHIEMRVDGITSTPINIKSMEIASQAINADKPTEIGTRFGVSLKPYSVIGGLVDYKAKNPFTIYKGSTPYLYLTNDSGIKLLNTNGAVRGISIDVNKSESENYLVNVVQASIKYNNPEFSLSKTKLLEFKDKNRTVVVYVTRSISDTNIGTITAETSDGTPITSDDIDFYINGVLDNSLEKNEWSMLGIQFKNKLDFGGFAGNINIVGPLLISFMSQEKLVNTSQTNEYVYKTWQEMLDDQVTWDAVDEYLWSEIFYTVQPSSYNINPRDVYLNYIGTNKNIVDHPTSFRLNEYEYRTFVDTSWQTSVLIPT